MGFSVDADIYEGDAIAEGHVEENHGVVFEGDILRQYADLRIEEGLTMQEAAQRMGVSVAVAENLNRSFLRLGRPDPQSWLK